VLNVHFLASAESGNLARALDCSHRSVALAEAAGDRYGAARALHNRGILLGYLGEFQAAQDCLRDVVARFEALPDQQSNACFARVSLASACLKHARQLATRLEQLEAQDRLLQMHVARGDHAQALAGLRAARAERVRLEIEQARLSCCLAAVERQVRLRQAVQHEAQAHMQRLAVVGRLMADIHHALDRPLTQVQQALAACAAAATPDVQGPALLQVVRHVEAAAGLARQLRMFSYRAAPQPMVVNLQDSLREAWDGVALRRSGTARQLQVTGDPLTQVRADVQRLAVLLRILLIEVDQAWPEGALAAHLAQGPGGGCLQLGGMTAATTAGPAGVGLTLCREIAEELAGALTHGHTAAGGAAFLLELPLG
jgi:C4-dicarboxylate-specific signal transduction histidine kinase